MTLAAVPLPDVLKRGVDPASPLSTRIAFARGDVPMSAIEKLGVLTHLVGDPHPEVRKAAESSIARLETSFIEKALGIDFLHPAIIDLLASRFSSVSRILYHVVSHPNISEETLLPFAESRDPGLLRTIAENNPSLGRFPSVIEALVKNPALSYKIADSLQAAYGVEGSFVAEPGGRAELPSWLEEIPEAEAAAEQAEEPVPEGPAEEVPAEEEPAERAEEKEAGEEISPAEAEISEALSATETSELPEELMMEGVAEEGSANLYKLIQGLSIAEKIKLATLGSKGARKLLSRDSNRTVVNAVIRSPKIRDDEVLAISQDKMTPDEVIFFILTKKEWLKEYSLRLALSQNPKTPPQKAFRLLETLYDKDIKHIAKSKNVPQIIAQAANRIHQRRQKKKN